MGRTTHHLHPPPPLHVQAANHSYFSPATVNGNGNGTFLSAPPAQQHQQSVNGSAISPLRLTPRDDSTRVQLQRQRLKDQTASVIVSKTIPGLKTSAAFFASLRTNLRLHASPPASPMSTPPSMRASTSSLPPPSPLSQPVDSPMADTHPASDPLSDIPELHTYWATTDDDRIEALKLTADSIAQMRQQANSSLITNPLNMAVAVAILALTARYFTETRSDVWLAGTTCAGILMAMLAACRWLTQEYIFTAETINFEWLGDADVVVTKFGDEIIGTAMVDWVSGEGRQKRKKAWKGEVKAWTVKLRYRGKSVGTALLEEVVKEAKGKGAETVEFAEDHANAKRILPSFYNGAFDKRARKARELLSDLLENSPVRGKRR
ncbi:hypothetical protein LTR62_003918 [Meristemomyces frigidus]|uniref:N-acetyltransferase domain-containing protein n=1 Tax=Meristemomyces frigidus TaxID=1508187 RepID=A0AAN7YGG2_9PEZI|nr:hypothetical protein LTR62_003918 [Meristemomyces frigidus]